MPIDYSKFDNIGSDDDEEEDDRRRGGGAGGSGNAGGMDFQQLLQQLQYAESKDPNKGSVDPGMLPDMYAAAGLGGGASGSRRKGGAGPPPAPFAPPPPPPCGMGLGFDPSADYDDEYGGLDDGLGASRALDYAGLRQESWQLFCNRLVTLPGPPDAVPRLLLLEAEVHLLASRYRQALVAGLAVQQATEGADANCTPACPYGDWTAPTLALEMVCCYQLGDRDHALELRETVKDMDRSFLSEHLAKRFDGTCEVLELVPALLNLLKNSEKEDSNKEHDLAACR